MNLYGGNPEKIRNQDNLCRFRALAELATALRNLGNWSRFEPSRQQKNSLLSLYLKLALLSILTLLKRFFHGLPKPVYLFRSAEQIEPRQFGFFPWSL